MTLKTGVIMLIIQLCIPGLNYILIHTEIENCNFRFHIVILFHNITVFEQLNVTLVSKEDISLINMKQSYRFQTFNQHVIERLLKM